MANNRTAIMEKFDIEGINIPAGRRSVDIDKVNIIARSMDRIGLRTPITVRSPDDGTVILVAGLHRLEAAKKLGWAYIDCIVMDNDEIDAELWEISENLHRAELTTLERGEQIGRWVALAKVKAGQLAHPQPHDAGISRAAKELGVERTEVRRAVKVANLTDAAKAAAREEGLDDNQSVLLHVAAAPADMQADIVHIIAESRRKPRARSERSDAEIAADKAARQAAIVRDLEMLKTVWRSTATMQVAWKRANEGAQERFAHWLRCGGDEIDHDDDIDGSEAA